MDNEEGGKRTTPARARPTRRWIKTLLAQHRWPPAVVWVACKERKSLLARLWTTGSKGVAFNYMYVDRLETR